MLDSNKNQNLRKKILKDLLQSSEYKKITSKLTKSEENSLSYFVQKFIHIIPQDYLDFLSKSDLTRFLLDRFHFVQSSKSKNKFSTKISVSPDSQYLWIINSHIIELIHKDMTFLKNSTLELLQQEGYQLRYFLTDILNSSELTDHSIENGGNFYYSYIIIEKKEDFNSADIKNKLRELFEHLTLVTGDFQPIIKRLNVSQEKINEKKYQDFLTFLMHDNFIFFSLKIKDERFGLSRDFSYSRQIDSYLKKIPAESFHILKTRIISKINRGENILVVKINDIVLTGIFTRKADNTSSMAIGLLSDKIQKLTRLKEKDWTALDFRDFVYAFNLLPLSYRFIIPVEGYIDFSSLLYEGRVTTEGKVRLRSFKKNSYFLLIIWPVNDISEEFQTKIDNFFKLHDLYQIGSVKKVLSSVAYFLYELETKKDSISVDKNDFKNLEDKIFKNLLTWEDSFHYLIEEKFSYEKKIQFKEYIQAIEKSNYKEVHSPHEGFEDLNSIIELGDQKRYIKSVYYSHKNTSYLKIYTKDHYSLSYFIPIFTNMELNIISEESSSFKLSRETVYFYRFEFTHDSLPVSSNHTLGKINKAIYELMEQSASSEPLNALLLNSDLNIFQIELLKALVSYYSQIRKGHSKVLIKKILQNNPEISESLVKYFEIRFLKKIQEKNKLIESTKKWVIKKSPEISEMGKDFFAFADKKISNVIIKNIIQSEIYQGIRQIIENIIRTNYFSEDNYLSFKIQSENIGFIKKPSPLFEIWVYHPHFEGIHLRGGYISRGGIRWSDRPDDFRTEIWGLWKTQVLKNTIIVPTGAKGGFVLKYIPNTRENAVLMYKQFIRALIGLTDNLDERQELNCKIPVFDQKDIYLVVAADKGTASFSDYANEISVKENYWLGDAFASGGANGYSHKDLGITALGAWESARWHLHRLGIDPLKNEFSVVGIGDLSGDVFGNGMIFSDKIKLIGAFNHKHIFIDPVPDIKKSFEERKRLFKNSLDWSYYNKDIISKGGGVFDRESAEIKLSSSVKTVLVTEKDQVTGEELIQILLKAPVEMIFNGGIGTYIKASTETNADIDDLSNDSVRVNSTDVRSKVIVEGGNLGVSPEGRVEYNLKGGLINADAVDNSAGVDLSDHEVNNKILLQTLIKEGEFNNFKERNKVLKSLAGSQVNLVLRNNFRQNWALIYLQNIPDKERGLILSAVDLLKKEKLWDDTSENLKNLKTLENCLKSNLSFPIPILAKLHSLMKIYIDKEFDIELKKEYSNLLISYFPEKIHKYQKQMEKHPLKNDIIKMMLINHVTDLIGFTGIVKSIQSLFLSPGKIISFYHDVYEIMDVDKLRINKYLPDLINRKLPANIPLNLTLEIKYIKENSLFHLIQMIHIFEMDSLNDNKNLTLPEIPSKYNKKEALNEFLDYMGENDLNEIFQLMHIELRFALKFLKIKNPKSVEEIYFNFGIYRLKNELYAIETTNEWEIKSLNSIKKIFWSGLVSANPVTLKEKLKIFNIEKELSSLKSVRKLNISTLTGLISDIFN